MVESIRIFWNRAKQGSFCLSALQFLSGLGSNVSGEFGYFLVVGYLNCLEHIIILIMGIPGVQFSCGSHLQISHPKSFFGGFVKLFGFFFHVPCFKKWHNNKWHLFFSSTAVAAAGSQDTSARPCATPWAPRGTAVAFSRTSCRRRRCGKRKWLNWDETDETRPAKWGDRTLKSI